MNATITTIYYATIWNDLPLHLASAPSLAAFKTTTQDLSVFPFLPRHYHMTRMLLLPFINTVRTPVVLAIINTSKMFTTMMMMTNTIFLRVFICFLMSVCVFFSVLRAANSVCSIRPRQRWRHIAAGTDRGDALARIQDQLGGREKDLAACRLRRSVVSHLRLVKKYCTICCSNSLPDVVVADALKQII